MQRHAALVSGKVQMAGYRSKVVTIAETRAGFKELSGKQDEMIAETGAGFKENNARLHEISAKQDSVIDAIDEARADVVSEVQGLRSDLKGRMEERLERIEGDVVEIKARMKP
jgi:hypothetical protein